MFRDYGYRNIRGINPLFSHRITDFTLLHSSSSRQLPRLCLGPARAVQVLLSDQHLDRDWPSCHTNFVNFRDDANRGVDSDIKGGSKTDAPPIDTKSTML